MLRRSYHRRLKSRLPRARRSYMVERSEIGDFRAAWFQCHGLSEGGETLGLLSRVRRAASRLRVQPPEPVLACYGPGKRPL